MPKLILSMDGLVLNEIALDKERILIGRKPHTDVQIDNLAISGEHASLRTIGSDAFLEDLNSTNGTYVNGQMIKKCILRDLDVVELGKYRLKYLADAKVTSKGDTNDYIDSIALKSIGISDALENGMEEKTGSSGTDSNAALSASKINKEAPPVGVLRFLSGKKTGSELRLDNAVTRLGRHGEQVVAISRHPQGYFFTHVEGPTPPLLNGRKIGVEACLLREHDVIEIASVKMEFYTKSG